MKYTKEEALKRINQRAKVIRRRHQRKVTNVLATFASFCLITLFSVIGAFSGSEVSGNQIEYGAFILSAGNSLYMLIAVLGFVLGVCTTLLVLFYKRKKYRF